MANLTISTVDVGLAAARTSVTVTLTDLDGNEVAGNLISSGAAVVVPRTATTAADGTLTLDLIANALITPANTYYTVRIKGYSWLILKTASTQTLLAALAADPEPLGTVAAAAAQATADAAAASIAGHLADTIAAHALTATSYDGTGQAITTDETTGAAAVQLLDDTLARVRARPFLGGRLSGVGDSMMEGYEYGGLLARDAKPSPMSVLTWACFLSGGRLAHVRNRGVGGTTSAECLASITDVLTEGPSAVLILTGTNDPSPQTGDPITPAGTRANVLGIVDYLRANDVVPIVGTLVAKDFEQDELGLINAQLRDLAAVEDVELWDFAAALMDPTTGSPLAGMTFDGTHTGPLGARTLAERVVIGRLDDIGARPCTSAWLAPWDDDPANLIAKACFSTGGIVSGAPVGWTASNLSSAGTAARTLVPPDAGSEVQGQWLRFTLVDLAGSITVQQTIDPAGWDVGDWLTIAVRCRWAGLAYGDVRWTAGLLFGGSAGAPQPVASWGHELVGVENAEPSGDVLGDGGIATMTYQIPAASTTCTMQLAVAGTVANQGTIDFGQVTVVNHGTTPPGS